jgi:microcystin-dependent protein
MLPKERKYFVTGDAVFSTRIPLLLLIPDSQIEWVYLNLFGALDYLSKSASWYTGGETTPEEIAEIFEDIYDTARPMLFLIGMISDFAAPLPDDSGWLQCDGTAYLQTDFPDLYAAIGSTYDTGGEPTGTFRVPDLLGRVRATINGGDVRLPSWANASGGIGGESGHTLDVSEIPAHSHTDIGHTHVESTATPSLGAAIVGVPVPSAIPSVGVTASGSANLTNTGGGVSHNNVQPTMAVLTYVLAKF